jgi:predicted amidohydrolase
MDAPAEAKKGSKKNRKFRELAESRTNKAIEAISRIGNLSNRQLYDYDEIEVRKIVRALREAVSAIEMRFGLHPISLTGT